MTLTNSDIRAHRELGASRATVRDMDRFVHSILALCVDAERYEDDADELFRKIRRIKIHAELAASSAESMTRYVESLQSEFPEEGAKS